MTDAFDVSVYLMSCARDCLDEPPLFGPRRMIEATSRLVAGTSDPVLQHLAAQMDRDDFAGWLDDLVGDLAEETLKRELSGERSQNIDAVIDRFWTAYNAHEVDAAVSLYAADATHHEVAQGKRAHGAAEIGSGLSRFLESFPDAQWEERRRIVSDDSAAIAYRLRGHLAAPLGPFRTPGRALDLEGTFVIEAAQGQITATSDYWDAATFGRQMQETR